MPYLATFLLFFLSLAVFPFANSWFEVPKVVLAQLLIEILIISFLFRSDKLFKDKLFVAGLFGLFILSLIHLLFFQSPTHLFGNQFRMQGIFLLWHLLAFSLISSKIILPKLPFLGYLPLFGLLISIPILGGNEAGRPIGTLGEPNALAAAAVFLWPFGFFGGPKKIKFAALALGLIIILLSGSRSGLLAFALQVLFLATSRFSYTKALILSFVLLGLTLVLPFLEGGGWFENRSEVWKTAFHAGLRSPIIGNGFGNVEHALKGTSQKLNNNIQYQYVDSSHNFLLDFWVQGGLLGLLLITTLIYISISKMLRFKSKQLVVFIGVLAVMSFNPVSVVTLLAFWYLLSYNNQA